MSTNKSFSKILAWLLTLCMILNLAGTVYAQDDSCTHEHDANCGYVEAAACNHVCDADCGEGCIHEHDDICGYVDAVDCDHVCNVDCGGVLTEEEPADTIHITGFDDLGESGFAAFDLGDISSAGEIGLPDSLDATDSEDNSITIEGVAWECADGFDAYAAGAYMFTALLPEGYTPDEGVNLPTIMVYILDGALIAMPMSAAWDGGTVTAFTDGDGSQGNPYQIATAAQLAYLAQEVNNGEKYENKYFILTDDIDLNSQQWTPIGLFVDGYGNDTPFKGSFDGNGHTISGLAIGTGTVPSTLKANGLFGLIGGGGELTNLTVHSGGVYVSSVGMDGVLVGYNFGTITNCSAAGNASGGLSGTTNGVLVGYNVGPITNCYAAGSATGAYSINGGLVGYNVGAITNCYAAGIASDGGFNGGLIGYNAGGGTVTASYFNNSANTDGFGSDNNNQTADGKTLNEMREQDFADQLNDNIAQLPIDSLGYFWIMAGPGQTPSLSGFHDGTGGGTAQDPYIIKTEAQLRGLAAAVIAGYDTKDEYYRLANNINLTGEWAPIGWFVFGTPKGNSFRGNFDGCGHTISGLKIGSVRAPSPYSFNGLFGATSVYATLKNLRVEGIGVYGGDVSFNGILAGVSNGSIINCATTGNVTGGADSSNGGLVGQNINYANIINCYATGSAAGGANSYNGGLAGGNFSNANITNCYAIGSATGGLDSYNGGLAGINDSSEITNCYATGAVTGGVNSYNGGLVGENKNNSTITDSYFNAANTNNGLGTARSLSRMKTDAFMDTLQGYVDANPTVSTYALLDWVRTANKNSDMPYLNAPHLTPPTVYTITFNANGGSVTPTSAITGADGKLTTLPIPTRSGNHRFDGWFTRASGGTRVTENTLFSANTTVYAYWTYTGDDSRGTSGGTGALLAPAGPETGNKLTTPKGQDPVVDKDGNTTLPGGGTVETPGGATIAIPAGTTIDKNGKITIPEGKEAEVKFPGGQEVTLPGGSTIDGGGNITTGGNTQINLPGNGIIDVPNGSTISNDGRLTVGAGGGSVSFGDITLHIKENTILIFDDESPLGYIVFSANPFTDVNENDWFYDYVSFAYTHGLFSGTSATTFSPNEPMTRAMFATVLSILDGADLNGYTSSRFGDVEDGQWYTESVEWAANMGIVSGVGNGNFDPDAPINREQLAVMLYNYMKHKGYAIPSSTAAAFADEGSISSWAREAVSTIQSMGIVSGKPGNLYDPQGIATRAEVATIFTKFVEYIAEATATENDTTANSANDFRAMQLGKEDEIALPDENET